eukprot:10343-Heterococcus_DN1.PRE.5
MLHTLSSQETAANLSSYKRDICAFPQNKLQRVCAPVNELLTLSIVTLIPKVAAALSIDR